MDGRVGKCFFVRFRVDAVGVSCLLVVGLPQFLNPGCMKQEKWIAALRHDALTGIIKLQKVPPKRADSQARSRSFWFLVVEVSLGLKQLAGLSRGKGWMVSGMFCWACYVLENKWRNEPVSVAGGCPCKKEETAEER